MDSFIGEIRLFGGIYVPDGWLRCDGSLVNISQYQALFALIGTTYGGDGVTKFGLPDLKGRVPIGYGQGAGLQNNYAFGANGGAQTVALTPANLPTHTHSMNVSNSNVSASTPGPTMTFGKLSDPQRFYVNTNFPTTATVNFSAQAVSTVGEGAAHNNVMPSLALTYMICWEGLFPVSQ